MEERFPRAAGQPANKRGRDFLFYNRARAVHFAEAAAYRPLPLLLLPSGSTNVPACRSFCTRPSLFLFSLDKSPHLADISRREPGTSSYSLRIRFQFNEANAFLHFLQIYIYIRKSSFNQIMIEYNSKNFFIVDKLSN